MTDHYSDLLSQHRRKQAGCVGALARFLLYLIVFTFIIMPLVFVAADFWNEVACKAKWTVKCDTMLQWHVRR